VTHQDGKILLPNRTRDAYVAGHSFKTLEMEHLAGRSLHSQQGTEVAFQ